MIPIWRLGSPFGVPLRIHATFWALPGFALATARGNPSLSLCLLLLVASFSLCVLLHEYAHVLLARRFGVTTRDVTLYPIGGLAIFRTRSIAVRYEVIILLAGPILNLLLAAVSLGGTHSLSEPPSRPPKNGVEFVHFFGWMNLGLATFNLLPIFPLDGGRIFRAVLGTLVGRDRATQIAAGIGIGGALMLCYIGTIVLEPIHPLSILFAGVIVVGCVTELKRPAEESRAAFAYQRLDAMKRLLTAAEEPLVSISPER